MVHGTSYNVITTVNKNEYIRVFAGVGEWYIVQTDSDYVGAVSRKYVRAIYPSSSGSSNSGTGGSSSSGILNVLMFFNLVPIYKLPPLSLLCQSWALTYFVTFLAKLQYAHWFNK